MVETAKALISGSLTMPSLVGDPSLLLLSDKSWYPAVGRIVCGKSPATASQLTSLLWRLWRWCDWLLLILMRPWVWPPAWLLPVTIVPMSARIKRSPRQGWTPWALPHSCWLSCGLSHPWRRQWEARMLCPGWVQRSRWAACAGTNCFGIRGEDFIVLFQFL